MCARGATWRSLCSVVVLCVAVAAGFALWPRSRFVYTPHPHAQDWTGGRARTAAEAGATAARFPNLAAGEVREFSVHVADQELEALQRRLEAAVLPPLGPVTTVYGEDGWQGGVNAGTLRRLVARWRSGFDWRAAEARINELPHFVTTVGGLALHFVHAKAQAPAQDQLACPVHTLLLLHGWPGSVVEFLDIIPMLTTCRDGMPVFNVVAPSMPGYGWSDPPLVPGLDTVETAALYVRLMEVLQYDQYYVQGGDWGGCVGRAVAAVAPQGRVLGLHVNFMPMFPNAVVGAAAMLAPSLVLGQDAPMVTPLRDYLLMVVDSTGYLHEHATRPDTVGTVLAASPVSLAAWLLEKFQAWSDCSDNVEERFSLDDLLTHITLYWTTQCITTSVRLYKETLFGSSFWQLQDSAVTVPLGYADFPREVTRTPEAYLWSVAQAGLRYSRMQQGGHFAAAEEPGALAADVRAFVAAVESER